MLTSAIVLAKADPEHCSLSADSCPDSASAERRTGPTDHWPTVTSAGACKLEHCSREMASCVLDPRCMELLSCPSSCAGDSFVEGLCAFECGEAGLRSETFLAMMTCWGTHRCQEARPQAGGPCAALSIDEGDPRITSLDMISGEWWVVRAWNCEGSGILFASCQHWNIQPGTNTVNFSLAGPRGQVAKMIRQRQSLVYPGVVRGLYDETNAAMSNLPQLEDYHIIDTDEAMEKLLVLWCHGTPEMSFNGALVLSRSAKDDDISPETLRRFNTAISNHGYDPEEFCSLDNSQCH